MIYLERSPTNILAGYVKRFWALEYLPSSAEFESETVIPDGCIEIIFNLGSPFRRFEDDGSFEFQPLTLVAGQIERGLTIGPSGPVRLFGIRFFPAGAYPFFPFEISELSRIVGALDDLWGTDAWELVDLLRGCVGFDEQIRIVEAALLKRLISSRKPDPIVSHTVDAIVSGGGVPRIRELAKAVELSQRTFERRFKRAVGLNPKAFSRIVRFQKALKMIRSDTPSVMDAVFELGYYDQSHLINDFRQYARTTPSSFLQKERGMADIFLTGED